MTIANVALTHTFDTWRIRTNDTLTVVNGLQNGTGFANVASLKIQGIGATGQFLKIANSATGLISSGDGAADFADLTGTISGSQFPPSITIAANTSFTGATKTLGSAATVKISGGTSGQALVTDGAGNLSWATASSPGITYYRDTFSPSGSTAVFTLSGTPVQAQGVIAVLNGVTQLAGSYSISGNQITFGSNPPAGTSTLDVYWQGGSTLAYVGNRSVTTFVAAGSNVAGVSFIAGTSTSVTLLTSPASASLVSVVWDGVEQHHSTWTLAGAVINFNSTIPADVGEIEVSVISAHDAGTPSDGTVTWAKLAAAGVYSTDGTLAANSDALVPTQKAVKTYADTKLASSALGVTVQGYNANTAISSLAQTWTKPQRGSIGTLTDGATITPDFSTYNDFTVTLGGNRTLANPTNITVGQKGTIYVNQDGTGSRTLAFGTYYKWSGGTAPTLTTTASAVDVITYHVISSTFIRCDWRGDYK